MVAYQSVTDYRRVFSPRSEAMLRQQFRLGSHFSKDRPDLDATEPPAYRPALDRSIADLLAEFPAEVGVGLTGRLLHRQGCELVIEIAIDGPVDWDPKGAEVFWSDGTRLVATIDARLTTRSGRIAAGLLIRLALRLDGDGPPAAPAAVIVSGGPAPLTVTLRAR